MIDTSHNISINPVKGGFIIHYPVKGSANVTEYHSEVATSVGKAMRIAKAAVEEFSLVAKAADES